MIESTTEACFEGLHCTISVQRPHAGIVLVTFEGRDTGELGDAAFQEIAKHIASDSRIELFIDARSGKAASIDVSAAWARWLAGQRSHLRHVSMLTGSRFIQISADFVRKFADLGDIMRLYTDAAAFEGALAHSIANARSVRW
jgi:hypothetical protein